MFTQTNDAVVWQYVRQHRLGLLTYFETLTEDEWNRASLSGGWMVRDVLAHLILEYHYTAANSWKDLVLSGFRINDFLRRTAVNLGRQSPDELLTQFRAILDEQNKPRSVATLNVLVDLLVHEQDIRIPLGHAREMPIDYLRLVFTHWEPANYNFGEKITGVAERVKGLTFVISDLDIRVGSGVEVRGKAQDILLSVVGRDVALDKLSGPGALLLHTRK